MLILKMLIYQELYIIIKINPNNISYFISNISINLLPNIIPKCGMTKCIKPTILASCRAFLFVTPNIPTPKDKEKVSIDKAIPINNILKNSFKQKTS